VRGVGPDVGKCRHPTVFRPQKILAGHALSNSISQRKMSAIPPKADIGTQPRNVRYVKQTKCNAAKRALFDHLGAQRLLHDH
jgi:hypothetical protein